MRGSNVLANTLSKAPVSENRGGHLRWCKFTHTEAITFDSLDSLRVSPSAISFVPAISPAGS